MTEAMVYVHPQAGIFRAPCEVEDTPDAEVKIFRFKQWPGRAPCLDCGKDHGLPSGMCPDGSGPNGRVRHISVFSYWNNEYDIGEIVAEHRVTAQLDTPPGYVAAYEGTTKAAPVKVVEPDAADNDAARARLLSIEDKIMSALETGGSMVISALKRKTHAYRFGEDWEKCLRNLEEQGELETRAEAGRVWVSTTTRIK